MTVFGSGKVHRALRGAKAFAGAARARLRTGTGRQARRQLALKDAEILALKRELARARGGGVPEGEVTGRTPVFFVVGQQKSGTTWLMRTLDSHPEILCRGEGRFFGAGWRQESVKRRDARRPPSSLLNAVLDAEYLRLWIERSVWSRDDAAGEHLSNLTRMTVDYFLLGELAKTGKKIVGDKSPLLTPETVEEMAEIYPEAKVIHIIRDGRDAAVSAAHHARNFGRSKKNPQSNAEEPRSPEEGVFSGDQLAKLASEWAARVIKTARDGPALLGENYVEVRYEDLLDRPEEEVRRLLLSLGARADEKTAARCVRAASFEKLSKGRKRGEEDSASFFRKGVAGDWKNVFTQRDRAVFKEHAGDALVELGYEDDRGW